MTNIGLNQKAVRPTLADFRKGCLGGIFVLVKVNGYMDSLFG
jgi:hypothetical protein